jgi:hypothetical protein
VYPRAGLTHGLQPANVCSIAVTSPGHAYAQFQRALKTGNPILALEAARELKHVTLEDALGLCLVMRQDKCRYQRAAARWLARYHAEVEAVTLTEIRAIADLMAALPAHGAEPAAELAEHLEQRGLYRCAQCVRDLVEGSSPDADCASG